MASITSDSGFDTLSLHAAQQADESDGARASTIPQIASCVFKSLDHAASILNVAHTGRAYSRSTNPGESA